MSPGRLRIGAGRFKGRPLRVGRGVRPSGSRLRSALFDRWGERIDGARFLDLFAGTGAVGLEAVSRGAEVAVLVEGSRSVVKLLQQNVRVPESGQVVVVAGKIPAVLGSREVTERAPYDLIYCDPPYEYQGWESLLEVLSHLQAESGEVVCEHPERSGLRDEYGILRRIDYRRYGDSRLSIYRATLRSPELGDAPSNIEGTPVPRSEFGDRRFWWAE